MSYIEAGAAAALADPTLRAFCDPRLAAWAAALSPQVAAAAAAGAAPGAPPCPLPGPSAAAGLDRFHCALHYACARVAARDGPLRGGLRVRVASPHPRDVAALHGCVAELAAFEGAPEEVSTSAGTFLADGFGPQQAFCALLVEAPPSPAEPAASLEPAAMALAHPSYSTWRGRTVYLEDLFVRPAWRRHGVAQRLFAILALAAVESGHQRLQWACLDWNAPAIALYEGRLHAARLGEWTLFRFEAPRLAAAARGGEADAEALAAAAAGGGGAGGAGVA
jgi:GNAT superfamily N-acetyltransferase